MAINDLVVVNINKYLDIHHVEKIAELILSNFSCPLNKETENFFRNNAIDFTKRRLSVAYIIFTKEQQFIGCFCLAVKTIKINTAGMSKNVLKQFSKIGVLNDDNTQCTTPAYLIAQLSKNFADGNDSKISGNDLLNTAIAQIRNVQYQIGGKIIFLEVDKEKQKVIDVYQNYGFKIFECFPISKYSKKQDKLTQMFMII